MSNTSAASRGPRGPGTCVADRSRATPQAPNAPCPRRSSCISLRHRPSVRLDFSHCRRHHSWRQTVLDARAAREVVDLCPSLPGHGGAATGPPRSVDLPARRCSPDKPEHGSRVTGRIRPPCPTSGPSRELAVAGQIYSTEVCLCQRQAMTFPGFLGGAFVTQSDSQCGSFRLHGPSATSTFSSATQDSAAAKTSRQTEHRIAAKMLQQVRVRH